MRKITSAINDFDEWILTIFCTLNGTLELKILIFSSKDYDTRTSEKKRIKKDFFDLIYAQPTSQSMMAIHDRKRSYENNLMHPSNRPHG